MPKILMLHRVLPKHLLNNYYFERDTAISWNRFIELLDYIEAENLQTFTISEMDKHTSEQSIFITFDDGYADNLDALNEILKRGMKATIYPVKLFIQKGFSPIDDMAFHLMEKSDVPSALYHSLMTGRLKKLIRRISFKRYRYFRNKWFGLANDALPDNLFLTENQLVYLAYKGIDFGIHGSSHRIFTSLSNNELLQELTESKSWLKSLGAASKLSICFPHGSHNQRVIDICAKFDAVLLGIDSAFNHESVQRRIHVKEISYERNF